MARAEGIARSREALLANRSRTRSEFESGLEGPADIFAPVAQGSGEPFPRLGAGRDQMGLTLPFHLEAILDAPQEAVGLQQLLCDAPFENSGLGQSAQGARSRAAPDLGHPSAVDEL